RLEAEAFDINAFPVPDNLRASEGIGLNREQVVQLGQQDRLLEDSAARQVIVVGDHPGVDHDDDLSVFNALVFPDHREKVAEIDTEYIFVDKKVMNRFAALVPFVEQLQKIDGIFGSKDTGVMAPRPTAHCIVDDVAVITDDNIPAFELGNVRHLAAVCA